jgi:hypothetical protein
MKLLIGNRNYSTWSLRPWLVLRHFEIPFEDEVLQLSGPRWRELIAERSPTGKVPVLVDGSSSPRPSPSSNIWPIAFLSCPSGRVISATGRWPAPQLPRCMAASLPFAIMRR